MEARRQVNPITGVTSYPEPNKGYLEQDAELMLAFEVLEELYDEHEAEQERIEEIKKARAAHFGAQQ